MHCYTVVYMLLHSIADFKVSIYTQFLPSADMCCFICTCVSSCIEEFCRLTVRYFYTVCTEANSDRLDPYVYGNYLIPNPIITVQPSGGSLYCEKECEIDGKKPNTRATVSVSPGMQSRVRISAPDEVLTQGKLIFYLLH
jgi:hypothetical protein